MKSSKEIAKELFESSDRKTILTLGRRFGKTRIMDEYIRLFIESTVEALASEDDSE